MRNPARQPRTRRSPERLASARRCATRAAAPPRPRSSARPRVVARRCWLELAHRRALLGVRDRASEVGTWVRIAHPQRKASWCAVISVSTSVTVSALCSLSKPTLNAASSTLRECERSEPSEPMAPQRSFDTWWVGKQVSRRAPCHRPGRVGFARDALHLIGRRVVAGAPATASRFDPSRASIMGASRGRGDRGGTRGSDSRSSCVSPRAPGDDRLPRRAGCGARPGRHGELRAEGIDARPLGLTWPTTRASRPPRRRSCATRAASTPRTTPALRSTMARRAASR